MIEINNVYSQPRHVNYFSPSESDEESDCHRNVETAKFWEEQNIGDGYFTAEEAEEDFNSAIGDGYFTAEEAEEDFNSALNMPPTRTTVAPAQTTAFQLANATPSKAWRYLGRISCLARIPIYQVGRLLLTAKIFDKTTNRYG